MNEVIFAQLEAYSADKLNVSYLVKATLDGHPDLDEDAVDRLMRDLVTIVVQCSANENFIPCLVSSLPSVLANFVERQHKFNPVRAQATSNQCVINFVVAMLQGSDPVQAFFDMLSCLFKAGLDQPGGDEEPDTPTVPPDEPDSDEDNEQDAPAADGPQLRSVPRC